MIQVKDIQMSFKSELTSEMEAVLKGLTFSVTKGDCLGILGESGSGKSTLARIIVGLLKPLGGTYLFMGKEPYTSKKDKKFLSENISVVFQDYNTSVNPRFLVREIIGESIDVLAKRTKEKIDKKAKVLEYLKAVGLDESFMERFPHQLSGGQLQRVCIARALAVQPQIILFDEAISSLDAHTQVQIMNLLKELQTSYNLTYIFITHDLTAVTYLCDKVLFVYNGVATDIMKIDEIAHSKDPYVQKLIEVVIEI